MIKFFKNIFAASKVAVTQNRYIEPQYVIVTNDLNEFYVKIGNGYAKWLTDNGRGRYHLETTLFLCKDYKTKLDAIKAAEMYLSQYNLKVV